MAKLNNLTLDGKPVDFILYRGSNQYGSYAIWNSGWKECWGYTRNSSAYEIVTFPISFSNTDYVFTTSEWHESDQTGSNSDTDGVDFGFTWSLKKVNSIRCSKASGRGIHFYACGW
mgnify:CR=1 FL=1